VAEAHWNEEAKALLTGLMLHIAATETPARRNLATLRPLITLPIDRFERLLVTMQASSAAGGLVARAANRHLAKDGREASGVCSAAQRHTHFLDSPRMTAVMARSDFDFAALKEQTATVFLVLPPDRISTYSRWLRLMVSQVMTDLARSPVVPPTPVLFLLDEFAALGRLEPVERAMGLMAGFGVQLWPILQDLHQLRGTYGIHAGTFLANAGLVQVFNVNDIDTAEWVSRGRRPNSMRPVPRASLGSGTGIPAAAQAPALALPAIWYAVPCSPLMKCAGCRPTVRSCSPPAHRRSSRASSATMPIPTSADCSSPMLSRARCPAACPMLAPSRRTGSSVRWVRRGARDRAASLGLVQETLSDGRKTPQPASD
jgi:type IV secretion system protein VirD4